MTVGAMFKSGVSRRTQFALRLDDQSECAFSL